MHRFRVLSLALLAGITLAACSDEPTAPLPSSTLRPSEDPPLFAAAPAGRVLKDRYIVVFNKDVTDVPGLARRLSQGGKLLHVYSRALKGFAVSLPAPAAEALQNNPNVAYIEQDMEV